MERIARVWNRWVAQYTQQGVVQRRLAGLSRKREVGWLDSKMLKTQEPQRFKMGASFTKSALSKTD